MRISQVYPLLLVFLHSSNPTVKASPSFLGTIIARDQDLHTSYDYVIVGGGLSGLVVANRLSEDRRKTVLVIEAGALYVYPPYSRSYADKA